MLVLNKPVHVVGMGLIGSVLAWELHANDIPFTWNDAELKVNAWRACTGSVLPSGDDVDQNAYRVWAKMIRPHWEQHVSDVVDLAPLFFLSKNPPHGGKYDVMTRIGEFGLGSEPSVHVNVPRLVTETRKAFASTRVPFEPDHKEVYRLVAHGFHNRALDKLIWGWSAKAKIQMSNALLEANPTDKKPCFYLRRGLYESGYCYPVPGEPDTWWIGSDYAAQDKAKLLSTSSKVLAFCSYTYHQTNGALRVTDVRDVRQGWRPRPRDPGSPLVTVVGDTLYAKAMGSSGVRFSPLIAKEFVRCLLNMS